MKSADLVSKLQYIVHLAHLLESMEATSRDMNAVAYRLFSKRMKTAMAGYPPVLLAAEVGTAHPAILDVLEQRHFDVYGALPGDASGQARRAATKLLRQLTGSPL